MDRRVSQSAREDAAARLSESWVAGALSLDTFESRVETVLRAASQRELEDALGDLPAGRRVLRPGADGSVVLGRSRSCDRTFRDDAISRHHALVRRAPGGRWRLHDLDSTNGTFLNGRRLSRSVDLCDGDEIGIGRLRLIWTPA